MLPNKITFLSFLVHTCSTVNVCIAFRLCLKKLDFSRYYNKAVIKKTANIQTLILAMFNVKIYFFLMSRGYKALNNYSERQDFKFPGVA